MREAGPESSLCVPDSCGTNTIAALDAGGDHACLVRKGDGAVWCWGRNDDGQLGDGTRTPRPLAVRVPSLTATAGGYVALFTASSTATALPAAVAVGMSGSMALVIAQTTLQRVIPGAALGRVSAVS